MDSPALINSKFHDYVRVMSVYELNRFGKYIQSPLYNEDGKLKRFARVMLPFAKSGTLEQLNEKKIWRAVFGSANYNRAKFIRLLSDTVKKIEHFLVLDRFQQQGEFQQSYLLEIMNERKLARHVPEFMSHALRKHGLGVLRDSAFYYQEFLLQQQKNLFLENRELRSAEKNIEEVVSALDVFYFINKLKYSAALLHYKKFLSMEAEVAIMHEVMAEVSKPRYEKIPAIQIYRYIILSFTESGNEMHYKKLTSLLNIHHSQFSKEEAKTVFTFAMNYCINQINYGRPEYLKELLSLYKQVLANELLQEDGLLSQWDYKNITTVALRVKDFKWAEKFIEDYKPRIAKPDRQNAYTFNRARYYFYIKNYDKVLQLLQTVEYNDIFYQLDSKTTLLKTYYELGEWQPLYSLKDSFRILLRRKKLITPQQKQNYMNLLKLTIRLFKCDVKDTEGVKKLRDEIEQTENVADKSWLMEKVGEILG